MGFQPTLYKKIEILKRNNRIFVLSSENLKMEISLYSCFGEEIMKKLFTLFFLILIAKFAEGLKTKGLPPQMRIAKASIIGCQHCSFVLKDFVDEEIQLFHNVDFKEATGSEKRIIHFFNQGGDKLLESDVTEYDLSGIIKLLKKQGFYRRSRIGEKLSKEAEEAPFIKFKYSK